jgi:glycosyltransferase involved in cell wall biosynthesis
VCVVVGPHGVASPDLTASNAQYDGAATLNDGDGLAVIAIRRRRDRADGTLGVRSVLLVSPPDGGVGDHAAATCRELERRGVVVRQRTLARGRTAAWRGIALAVRERRALRRSTSVHVELGRLDAGVFWFALAASLARHDILVVAHDAPVVLLSPAAALVPAEGVWAERLAYGVLGRLLDRPIRRLFDRRLPHGAVLTDRAAEAWRGSGRTRVLVVRQGADPPTEPPLAPSQAGYVLFAGYIGPVKGLDVLLDAWPAASEGSTFELRVAGGNADDDSAYVADLRRRAGEAQRVRWLGAVDAPALAELFARAAVVCVPYRSSNPASAILVRAMVEGRAIVATGVAAVVDAIGPDEALIVPPGDAGALARALGRAIREPELRDRLGAAAARIAADRYAWAHTSDDLLAAYAALATSPER